MRIVRTVAQRVTITYLELDEQDEILPPSSPVPEGFTTRIVHDPAINADLYKRVGADYAWVDRLRWSAQRWEDWAARVETHLVEAEGATAGYFELELEDEESAKIPIFGLLQEFHGRGIGGHALVAALRRARELRPRVWLTTNTMDGPHALTNYRARGMRPFRTETAAAVM